MNNIIYYIKNSEKTDCLFYKITDDCFYINNYKLKNRDIICYKCNTCNKTIVEQFRNKKKFYDNDFICHDCSRDKSVKNIDFIKKTKDIKKTKLEKYGDENFNNREKSKKTCLKKYGHEIPNGYGTIEYKQNMINKYNFDNPQKNSLIKKKTKKTFIEKYGITSISQLEKTKLTKIEKYNDIYYRNKEKTRLTNIKKYGYENLLQSREIQEKITLKKLEYFYNEFKKSDTIQPLFTLKEYLNKKKKYEKFRWKCKKCGNEFEDYYANGIEPRCFNCFPKLSGYSNSEKEVSNYCKSLGLEIIENDRSIISPYEIDIYIPSHKLAIEYNGLYWHSTRFIDDKYYHQNKVKLANEKGIRLLHVWEYEWQENKQSIYDKINYYLLNLNEEITSKEPQLYTINNNLIWL